MKEQTLASRKKNRNKRNMYSIKMKRCEKDLNIGKKTTEKWKKDEKKTGKHISKNIGIHYFQHFASAPSKGAAFLQDNIVKYMFPETRREAL